MALLSPDLVAIGIELSVVTAVVVAEFAGSLAELTSAPVPSEEVPDTEAAIEVVRLRAAGIARMSPGICVLR